MTFTNYNDNLRASANATNASAVATIPASTGNKIVGVIVTYSYSAAPTGATLTISDGVTTFLDVNVSGVGEKQLWLDGIETGLSNALIATLGAGGVGVVGKVTLTGKYRQDKNETN